MAKNLGQVIGLND